MRRILRVLSDLFEKASVAFLAILCLSVFTQIIMRNVFSAGSVVLEELARVSLVSLVFLMIPVLTIRKRQIIVDFFLMKLPARARRGLELAIPIVCVAASIFLIWAIALIMEMNWNVTTAAMKMPNCVFYLPVALGFALNALGSIDSFIATLKRKEAAE